ncbi:MAG: AAA family ATPase [Myxococcales bacterium]|nr:AAA family ATPase [Myxococcota bacterium]MDW8282631.1 AAA family ATPase [Myxococcales bacterium]
MNEESPSPRPEARGLAGLIGQEQVVRTLRGALASGRLHHAYLFDGPEGVGKATCARALFLAHNCLAPPALGEACGACETCHKVRVGTHPDLVLLDMTLQGLADEVERLIRRLAHPPHEARVRMVLLDPADNLAAPTAATAANRLLKTLEEPPARTHFVLITCAAQGLLPTIRSRTQRLRFVPLPDDLIAAELLARGHREPEMAVRLAQGSLGRALRYMEERAALDARQEAAGALRAAARSGAQRMAELAAEVGRDRDEAQETLGLLWLALHNELRAAVDGPAGIQRELLRQLRVVDEARMAIRRYTSAPLALEWMMRHLTPPTPGRPS